jgi:hypothetical protein
MQPDSMRAVLDTPIGWAGIAVVALLEISGWSFDSAHRCDPNLNSTPRKIRMNTTIEIIIAATLAIAAAFAVSSVRRRSSRAGYVSFLRHARGNVEPRRLLPWWLRLPLPLALPLADYRLGPLLPSPAPAGRARHASRRAGIDEELSPQQFLAVCAVLAAVVAPRRHDVRAGVDCAPDVALVRVVTRGSGYAMPRATCGRSVARITGATSIC